uniref:Solute carrier family 35 member F1 n=1 Tax=Caenorhabditis japonica TaxID=281687 RepID=A0A8R1E0V0_CAEJA
MALTAQKICATIRALILGQLLSLCLCGTGVSSQLLTNRNVNAPAAQSFVSYFLLCFVYCVYLAGKSDEKGLVHVLRKRGWRYLILAIVDVEANYMIVKAYQYTNLTSVQILDCATIPTVLLLSWLFLSVRYLPVHIIGVAICLVGISCVIWADAFGDKGALGGSNKVIGDVLCLAGAILYAICNVAEEFLVKHHSRTEYLGMLGVFGSIVAGIQTAVFERDALSQIVWDGSTIFYFCLFAISMFIFYSLVTVVLQKTSALMFNLSTLTADFYSLLFGMFLFKDKFSPLYLLSFVICVIGSIVYSLEETQMRESDEPRRLCSCLFGGFCCGDRCFGDGSSTEGSIDVNSLSISWYRRCERAPLKTKVQLDYFSV